ncbi:SLAP domain-containing protein [Oceanobacillus polygoni]|uniref:SLAP domain-containing protein n=1 Tax=Oceanobacillus polygoni TaxID=1235259 RepID=A0A9X0Z1I3_9BACI|nr:SLAP domain-containing protein [Oceanobacillus polygoni]MBP2079940.1 SLAP domain-containing protein [Oceanobacillus polygoni]
MQTLEYEASWDKALPSIDREKIEAIFQETSLSGNQAVAFTPLWQAMNYKGELLVTVLVHNFTVNQFSFSKETILYIEHNDVLAAHEFTIPALTLEAETSMPWAFIFPVESMKAPPTLEDGRLEFINAF